MINREVSIFHSTLYKFDRPVVAGPHLIRLQPSQYTHLEIFDYKMKILPNVYHAREQLDVFGNYITRLVFLEKIQFLQLEVEFKAKLLPFNPFDFLIELHAQNFPFQYEVKQAESLFLYLQVHDKQAVQNWYLDQKSAVKTSTLDFVIEMNKLVFSQFSFHTREEHGVQSPSETLQYQSGSCRDFSWFLINVYRYCGIAARFVSGYHVDINFDDEAKDKLVYHAWVEVFLPGTGWLGLDPTSGLLVNEFYIPLCSVPHYEDAAALIGNTENCEVTMTFESSLKRQLGTF